MARGDITINPDGVSIAGCSIIYAPRGQAGEYAPLATNPYRGCGNGCAYCLAPDTLIQMADGRTVPLSEIEIGNHLIGVVKDGRVHRYANSRVLNKISTLKPAFRIITDDGYNAICSADHRWLTDRGWKFTNRLTLNNSIRVLARPSMTGPVTEDYKRGYLCGVIRGDGTLRRYDYSGRYQRTDRKFPQKTDVQHHFRLAMNDMEALDRATAYLKSFSIATHRFAFQHGNTTSPAIRNHSAQAFEAITLLTEPGETPEWIRGFLAGIFDAEGGTTADVIRIHNKDSALLSLIDQCMMHFGFRTVRDVVNENGCTSVRIRGGREETVRFFNLTAPAIARKFPVTGGVVKSSSRIVSIEPLGSAIPMLDITTSTENFIANGMVSHNCYVPDVLRITRPEFDAGATPRQFWMEILRKDAVKYRAAGIAEQVMLSFTTDPYHPGDTGLTRETLQLLIEHGLGVCTLTKGGTRALRDINLFRRERDAFASTLTSLDDRFSKKWERNAAPPADRLAALRAFHERGIFTWVSLEPTLDVESSLAIVEATHSFVDLYKVGRANYLPMTKTTDWEAYTHRMLELLHRLGKAHYIKKDLQKYLPPGHHNPLRVAQHH